MRFVLAFGNPFIGSDSLALDIADFFQKNPLKGHEFVKCISPDEIMQYSGRDFFILDVAEGIDDITLLESAENLGTGNIVSLHDFDLGFFLKLAKEMGSLEKVNIICIPVGMDIGKAVDGLKSLLLDI